MYSLNHTIGLWMVSRGMNRLNAEQVQNILPKFRDEMASSVRSDGNWHTKASNPPCLVTCFSGAVSHWNCFWPMSKPVNYSEEIGVIS